MPKNRSRIHRRKISSTRVVLISFLVDVSDVLFNFVVALISGSVVMTTQTLQGVADVTASGLTLVGVRRSKKPPDKRHPFGYGRELYFWTIIAGLIMFTVTTTLSFYLGLQRFLHPQPIDNIGWAFGVLVIGFFTNGYSLSQSYRRMIGDRHYSRIIHLFLNSLLIETKVAFILDVTGTMASFVGMVALLLYQVTGNLRYDGFGAMSISLMMGLLTVVLIVNIKDLIIGRSADQKIQDQIIATTLSIREVNQVLDLRTIVVGSEKLLVNLEVHVSRGLKTRQIERLMDRIKEKLQQQLPQIVHIQVELETPDKS